MAFVATPQFRGAEDLLPELQRALQLVRDGWDFTMVVNAADRKVIHDGFVDALRCLVSAPSHTAVTLMRAVPVISATTRAKQDGSGHIIQTDPLWGPFVKSDQPWTAISSETLDSLKTDLFNIGQDQALVISVRDSRCVTTSDNESELRVAVLTIVVDQNRVLPIAVNAVKGSRRQQRVWSEAPLGVLAPVFQKQVHSPSFLGCSPHFSVVGDIDDATKRTLERIPLSVRQRAARGSEAIRGVRVDIERMRKMVAAAGSGPDAALTQQLLLEQIADAEAAVGPLQQLLDSAVVAAAARREEAAASAASRLAAQKNQAESLAAVSALKLSQEKQRAFAQAFRSAFLVDKEAQSRKEQEQALAEQIRGLREKLERLELQQVALKGERDRFQYDGLRTAKELRRVKSQLDDSHAANARLEAALASAQEETDSLATKISLARFESTAEIHELRAHSLAVERERDAIELKNEALREEIGQLRRTLDDAAREANAEVQRQIEGTKLELSAERAKRLSCERRIDELEGECTELRMRIAADRNDLAEATRRVDEVTKSAADERRAAKSRMLNLSSQHRNERASYAQMLREAGELIREMRRVEDFRISRTDAASLYRGGGSAVRTWLESQGMERYSSALMNAGFDDLASLVNITEDDLVNMKVLTGHRRKLLAHVEELKHQLRGHAIEAPDRSVTSTSQLIDKLSQWCGDFEATLEIEADGDTVPE